MKRLLACLIAVSALASLPACGFVGGGDTYEISALFPRAVSVFPSSDVRVLGLPAGEVKQVQVEGDLVRITMAIPTDIQIPADARAQIVPQSLIGERYIQLSPAFKEGEKRMEDGAVISGRDRIIVPVEPDEALAALKEFLDSLDPDGIGALVTNLEEDLRGNGAALNDMLGSLSELVATFAEKDDALLRIVDSFDQLTATLVTREEQLGEVLDAFAAASQVLADERESITDLVEGLADLSQTGLRIVGEHSTALRADIQTLADAAATIDANLSSVTTLLSAGNLLTTGLLEAYNPDVRAIDLRNNFNGLIVDIVNILLGDLGLPEVCEVIPVTPVCDAFLALDAGEPTRASIASEAPSPVGSLLTLLASDSEPLTTPPSNAERVGGWVHDASSTLLGEGS